MMHYHRSELMSGFDSVTLDAFLGIDGNAIPRFVTHSGGYDLSRSFASVIGQILKELKLPEDL